VTFRTKIFASLTTFATSATLGAIYYNNTYRSIFPSTYEKATNNLGFRTIREQESLLKIFHMARYLNAKSLYEDIQRMQIPTIKFPKIKEALAKANADQNNINQVDFNTLRKNFLEGLDPEDARDLLLYISQHAFRRPEGTERYELTKESWMKDNFDSYMEAAKDIGLINRVRPTKEAYDYALIAGASRPILWARMLDFKFVSTIYHLQIKHPPMVLTGNRELWAEIDGVVPIVK